MRSLRQRLTLTHTLVALLAVVLMALLAGGLIERAYRQLTVQQAQEASEQLRTRLAPLYRAARGNWNTISERLRRYLAESPVPEDRRVILTDASGLIRFDTNQELEGQPLPEWMRASPATAINFAGPPRGYIIIPVGGEENRSPAERTFRRSILFIIIAGGVASTAAGLVIAFWLARRLTAPLRLLTTSARRLAAGQHHEPIAVPAERELAELAQAFNGMAAELDRQEHLRRHMLADITHELRTPLSVLRLQVESLQDGIEQPTPEVFDSLHQDIGLLTRLVEDLRLISLADAGQLSLQIDTLDVQPVLDHIMTAALPHARQRGVDLRVEVQPAVPPVRADPQRLAQVLGNLVENALRYTPQSGKVVLRAGVQPDANAASWLVFEVADTGSGIAPEDLPHIFERFYRTDKARARETGGTGLGLAIVERLVVAQGGKIDVHSTPGSGTIFRVWLPMASATAMALPYTTHAAQQP